MSLAGVIRPSNTCLTSRTRTQHLSGGAMRSSMSSMIWLEAASASASGHDGLPSPPPSAARLIRPTRTSLRPHGAQASNSTGNSRDMVVSQAGLITQV